MEGLKHQDLARDRRDCGLIIWSGRASRLWFENLTGEENQIRRFSELIVLVLLLHIWIIVSVIEPRESVLPAKPLVMNGFLVAPSVEKSKAAVPVVKRSAPKNPRKIRPPPKKTSVAPKPRKPSIASIPGPAPTPVASEPQTSQTQSSSASTDSPAAAEKNTNPEQEIFTEARYRPDYRNNPAPEYPHIARKRGWEGTVLLLIQVTPGGQSANVTIHRTSGHKALDNAAVEAARKWTFFPAKRGETPEASSVIVPIHFRLKS